MAYRQDLFLETIKQLRGGKTQELASAELNALVQACRDTGKKGELVLSIEVRSDKGDSGQYFLKPKIKIKTPENDPGETIFWGTPEGNLQRTDPNQGSLDLRMVADKPKETRFIDEPQVPVKTV